MRWIVHGERVNYDCEWLTLALRDVEVPGGERFENHVVRRPNKAAGTVLFDPIGACCCCCDIVRTHDELVERETRRSDLGNERRDPKDPVCNLVDLGHQLYDPARETNGA